MNWSQMPPMDQRNNHSSIHHQAHSRPTKKIPERHRGRSRPQKTSMRRTYGSKRDVTTPSQSVTPYHTARESFKRQLNAKGKPLTIVSELGRSQRSHDARRIPPNIYPTATTSYIASYRGSRKRQKRSRRSPDENGQGRPRWWPRS